MQLWVVSGLWLCCGAALMCALLASQGRAAQPEMPVAEIAVPSGQSVTLSEVLLGEATGALWARFRFVAPQIASTADPERSSADLDHLCAALAVPYLRHYALQPERVVISLSDRALAFGTVSPEATQYFETYLIDGETCIWEGF